MLPCLLIYFLLPVLPQDLASLLFHCKCTFCVIYKTLLLTEASIRTHLELTCTVFCRRMWGKLCLGLPLHLRWWARALGVLWARQTLCEHSQGNVWLSWDELEFACKVLCKYKLILLGCLHLRPGPPNILLRVAVHSECSGNTQLRPQCLKSIQESSYTQVERVILFLGI